MKISISIDPTDMESQNGDRYSETALLDAIRAFVTEQHPGATIACLQIGHRQGDGWARVDGDDDAGAELMQAFWYEHDHGADESLFEEGGAA